MEPISDVPTSKWFGKSIVDWALLKYARNEYRIKIKLIPIPFHRVNRQSVTNKQ